MSSVFIGGVRQNEETAIRNNLLHMLALRATFLLFEKLKYTRRVRVALKPVANVPISNEKCELNAKKYPCYLNALLNYLLV